jgi:hypothetical protein
MKKLSVFVIILFFTLLAETKIQAQDKGFGAGIMVGQPTGFSAKNWVNEINAIDFGLGFSFAKDEGGVHIHADYLWHSFTAIQATEKFVVYYGPGLKLKTGKNNDAQLGIRGVLGLDWMSSQMPIDVFMEIAPVFNFVPGTGFKIDAAFGARYYFY